MSVSGKWISWAHTLAAYTAFLGALFTGLSLHYHKIVKNEHYVRKALDRLQAIGLLTWKIRATLKNGFPPSLLRLGIVTLNAPSSSYS